MEIKISTNLILKFLQIIAWLVFVGLCMEAGGFLFNTFYTLFYNPIGAEFFWNKLNFLNLYNFDKGYFTIFVFLLSIVVVFKAILFYLIIGLFNNKSISINKPFNNVVQKFLINIACVSLFISILSHMAFKYFLWFQLKNIILPSMHLLPISGHDVWFFMSIVLFVIAQVFKKAIEIQQENDLTI